MTVSFTTGLLPLTSRFHCVMKAIPDTCECGKRNNGRIVGGNETLINEFPSMAGVVDGISGIICGATISTYYMYLHNYFLFLVLTSLPFPAQTSNLVSKSTAVSAAHCFEGRNISSMTLVVAEHDTNRVNESLYTKHYRVARVIKHEQYDGVSSDFDIALMLPTTSFSFNEAVGPSCLPLSWVLLFDIEVILTRTAI